MKSAVIAAVVAALVSASGTYAASRVLITSTKQIAPPVLAQLAKLKAKTSYVQGPAGATGAEGKQGPAGVGESIAGPPGLQGPEGRSVVGPAGETGPRGEPVIGPRGEAGERGPAGELKNVTQHEQSDALGYGGGSASVTVECPSGGIVVGGGYESENPYVFAHTSHATATGWEVAATNTNGSEVGVIHVYALCAAP